MKKLSRARPVQELAGYMAAGYLRFVKNTTDFVRVPEGLETILLDHWPPIIAMWHGQHIMMSFGRPPGRPASALISRHDDAEINAIALRHLDVEAIRGSGSEGVAGKMQRRGGVQALRAMIQALQSGRMVVLTADVPKIARIAGDGIVTLAKLSGRPIFPAAVVKNRRFDFQSWDRASFPKPFGKGAIVLGAPIFVAADADRSTLESARLAVQAGLDDVHKRAYDLVGDRDPGADLRKSS
ncbi:DUF374 domain-containing protein [Methylovirgula sp. 4M-Z18]|nr:DUF374 domain-containing protein [Methylovirgula sp. 4M-Z18]